MRKPLQVAETCFVVFGLIFFSGGLPLGRNFDGEFLSIMPEIFLTMIRYFIWFTSTLLLLLNFKEALITARRDWILWIFLALALCSFAWSDDLSETFIKNREILQMISFGLYFAMRFTLKQQVRLIALAFVVSGILSTLLAIGAPSLGKHTGAEHAGAWKGIYNNKNAFGSMMVLGAIAMFFSPIERPVEQRYRKLGLGAFIGWILLSTSKTAIVLLLIVWGIMLLYRRFRWQGKVSVILLNLGILLLGCVVMILLNTWTILVSGLGRDSTLSGRTLIWEAVWRNFWERPWFGFGRGAFWVPTSQYAAQIGDLFGSRYIPPHAHNGYLETALDVGLIGLGLFLLSFGITYFVALRQAYAAQQPEDEFPLAFLTLFTLNNMTESFVLRLINVYFVLFIAIALTIKQRRTVGKVRRKGPLVQYLGASMKETPPTL